MDKEPEIEGEKVEQPEFKPEQPKTVTISAQELDQLRKDLAESKDKYLRALAEMENARKRMIKERQENTQQVVADVISEFLTPLDNMESALKYAENMSEDVKTWAIGFRMILDQFKEILTANGVAPIHSTGQPFDPHSHEAIETHETDDHAPGTIVEEYTRGYKMGKRTIRPARVKVAQEVKPKSASDEPSDADPEKSE